MPRQFFYTNLENTWRRTLNLFSDKKIRYLCRKIDADNHLNMKEAIERMRGYGIFRFVLLATKSMVQTVLSK